jgi:hypothetical protein
MLIPRFWLVALLLAVPAQGGPAKPMPREHADIRAVVARWYAELRKKEAGRPWTLTAPRFIDGSPHYRHANNGSARLGPRLFTSLAARALRFSYDVEAIRRDALFAKVRVWERGYFYASRAQTTYENAASTLFILEWQEKDGRWVILAHESSSQGIPPNKVTTPMPDLRELYYATDGKGRDPEADAREARRF